MKELPKINGRQVSSCEFMNYVRQNISQLSGTDFVPYSASEIPLWQSSNPMNAIISIKIVPYVEAGSVIVSEYSCGAEASSWTFTTIHDPEDHSHPVSGNRTFAIREENDGYVFYIQGSDRVTNYFDAALAYATDAAAGKSTQFVASDALWNKTIDNIAKIAGKDKGNAYVLPSITKRPNWDKVKNAIDNHRSLATIDCN